MGGDFDRDLRRLLTSAGWSLARQGKGSHEIWRHPDVPHRLTVPTGIKSRHTANAILRQARIAARL